MPNLGFEASPEAIVTTARKAEEVGFELIFVNDPIVVGNEVAADLLRYREATGFYAFQINFHGNRNLNQLLQSNGMLYE